MKRHESLAPLSREHHGALILAQLIKRGAPVYKGLPTTIDDKIDYAVDYYQTHLKKHFRQEEAMLEQVKATDSAIATMAEEIIAEHQMLEGFFLSLQDAADAEAALNVLGNELDAHIRKEERRLFPMIQKHCTEATMLKLAALFS
ncbi:MAG: hemerythrin domain-containing protein [Chitinophagaceae bacterium]|nr:hemerythrin domain-containing protein [Chitinophagaceae bacterium]